MPSSTSPNCQLICAFSASKVHCYQLQVSEHNHHHPLLHSLCLPDLIHVSSASFLSTKAALCECTTATFLSSSPSQITYPFPMIFPVTLLSHSLLSIFREIFWAFHVAIQIVLLSPFRHSSLYPWSMLHTCPPLDSFLSLLPILILSLLLATLHLLLLITPKTLLLLKW